MALDGITVHCIKDELSSRLTGGRIDKIYQPQKDEIILGVRAFGTNYKLLLSANASHPRAQLVSSSKFSPSLSQELNECCFLPWRGITKWATWCKNNWCWS